MSIQQNENEKYLANLKKDFEDNKLPEDYIQKFLKSK